jgi:hypothetical protein
MSGRMRSTIMLALALLIAYLLGMDHGEQWERARHREGNASGVTRHIRFSTLAEWEWAAGMCSDAVDYRVCMEDPAAWLDKYDPNCRPGGNAEICAALKSH